MANMMSKVKNMLGFGDEDEFIENYDEEVVEEKPQKDNDYSENDNLDVLSPKSGKVVNIHTNSSAKVLIIKPTDFEDSARDIADALKARKIVLINTSLLENRTARRLLDMVSGSAYALQGDFQEVEKGVYILTPSNIEVTSELKTEISSKAALFNWTK